MRDDLRIGVDIGGTKIEAVLVRVGDVGRGFGAGDPPGRHTAADAPDVLARRRVPTEAHLGYASIVERTRDLLVSVAKEADPNVDASTMPPIGVGMPGSITMRRIDGTRSDEPLVKNSNTTCLNGRPFHGDLERAVGRTIAFANDANCFALAEATWGSAATARVTFGVIVGTGVGGGIVLRDGTGVARAWEGAQGIAGEWGHVVLDPVNGPPCYCGRRGCIETYLSGPAIERSYAERAGTSLRLVEIASLARQGQEPAHSLFRERFEIFGRAMATVIDILDPDVVVLGGGMSNIDALYDEGQRAVAGWVFNDELVTRIVKNSLGDSAGVLGAALLEPRGRNPL